MHLDRVLFHRGDLLDQLVIEQELLVGLIALAVELRRIFGKQRQRFLPLRLFSLKPFRFSSTFGNKEENDCRCFM